ncbi:uncharacterized protein LOC124555970 [Schistocerca americana]|uniref:uncharacterized protein LOC124555970 n=1 Tax=Schistocerca americana TaxID=7009 RepID=UPI001F50024A|nr:uncharacterized protein LOC124555970 [Schistocerca americana]
MSLDFINREDFISEAESRPAIWDVKSDDYSNKVVETNAWQEIITKFVPDFNEKSTDEKEWVGPKEMEELKGQLHQGVIKEMRGSAATGRKEYIYFEQLRFLTIDCKSTTSSIENYDDSDRYEFDGGENLDQETREKTAVRHQKRSREKKGVEEEDDMLYHILKEKCATKHNSSQQEDEACSCSI